jgi:putative ABC transport system permease protein
MITHYLSTALRHFRRHKLTTAINLASLSLGLVCFVVAFALTEYFWQSDRHHANGARIYAVTERIHVPGTDVNYPAMPNTAWPVAEYLRADFPQLAGIARASMAAEVPVTSGDVKSFMQVTYADPAFTDLFDFTALAGKLSGALREPRSAIVSEALAMRLFGTRDVIGKPLLLDNRETTFIRAVIAPLPRPSHMSTEGQPSSLYFDAIVSMDTHEAMRRAILPPEIERIRYGRLTGALQYFTYVMLPERGFSIDELRASLASFGPRHINEGELRAAFDVRHVSEIPVQQLNMMIGTDKTGVSFTALLMLLGGTVLLVSCLNYANLAAAQAEGRMREVAMRRIIGAGRVEVIVQHAVEAVLLTAGALLLAGAMLGIVMQSAESRLTAAIQVALRDAPLLGGVILGVLVAVSALASSYPSLVLARVRLAHGLRLGRRKSASRFVAQMLVGGQFVAASFLLIVVLVMQDQNESMRRVGLDAGGSAVVLIANDLKSARVDVALLRSELGREPHVQAVSSSMTPPLSLNNNSYGTVQLSADRAAARTPVVQQYVDYDFFATLGFRLAAGRLFDREHGTDVLEPVATREQSVVIDRMLAAHYGWTDPAQAIGKVLYQPSQGSAPPVPARVIGVVDAKALTLLGLGATGSTFQLAPHVASAPLVRIAPDHVREGLAEIERVWTRLAPDVALKSRFLDEQFEQSYRIFTWVTSAFASLALLACVIAGMGLVGMALHMVNRRRHEIGIRKTLGASVWQVLRLLLTDFSRPVLIANLIAWPIAFAGAYAYLSVFVHREPLTATPFITSLVLTVAIAWAAVIAQATRAARLQPANVLRQE